VEEVGVSPLSTDPEKRARQLANLQPGAGAGDGGLQRARAHGGYAALLPERLEQKTLEIYGALAADAPLRDGAGGLPAHDTVAVALLAQCLCRLETVAADIAMHGMLEQRGKRKGQVRPAAELEGRLRREASGYLDALGCTPKSRLAMGLDLVRTVDLATAMSEVNPERRNERMRELGLIDDQEVHDA
jgi:hypothetical protein